jgi:hypothetical protein
LDGFQVACSPDGEGSLKFLLTSNLKKAEFHLNGVISLRKSATLPLAQAGMTVFGVLRAFSMLSGCLALANFVPYKSSLKTL